MNEGESQEKKFSADYLLTLGILAEVILFYFIFDSWIQGCVALAMSCHMLANLPWPGQERN